MTRSTQTVENPPFSIFSILGTNLWMRFERERQQLQIEVFPNTFLRSDAMFASLLQTKSN